MSEPNLLHDDRVFRLLVEAVRDYAIFMLDPQGRIASWNGGAERMTGYSAAEVIGRPFTIFYTEPDLERDLPGEELRIAEQQGSYEEEGWRLRKDGSRFWAQVTITAVRDDTGRLLGFGKVTRDLTQRRSTEQALRETAERFHELAENIQEVIWITSGDMKQVLYVSPAFERVWGRPAATAYEGLRGWLNDVHPEDRQAVGESLPRWAAGEFALEYRIVRPDGAVRWIHTRGVPVRGERGAVQRVVGIAEDVTRRREREEEQRYLAEAGRILSSSLDYEKTLARVARLAVPQVADWCAIYVAEGPELRLVDVAHRDPEKVAAAWEFRRRYPPDPGGTSGAYRVFSTGEPELIPEISESLLRAAAPDEEFIELIGRLGLRSAMTVPMSARGRTLGVITFVASESGRRYGPQDLAFAETLAARAALAIDNARLHREAETARRRATNILESITEAFVALDRDWRFTHLNPGAREIILGSASVDPGEVIGRSLWEVVPELDKTRFAVEYRAAMAEQKETHFEEYFAAWDTWFEVHVYPSAEGLSVFFRDVTARKLADQERDRLLNRERFLAQAGTVLASSLDYEATLETVARLAVPTLADYCLVDVLEDDGRLHRVATAHVDPEKERLLLEQRHPPAPGSNSPALNVLQPGRSMLIAEVTPEWLASVSQSPEHGEVMRLLAPRSAILVPLTVREQVLGLLSLARSESEQRYTEDDLSTAEELARRAATALENARLYRAVDEARGEAERRAREEAALRDAAAAVSASFTVDDVIRQISDSAVTATNSDGAFIQQINPEEGEVEVVAVAGSIAPLVGSKLPYGGSYVELVVERRESEMIRRLANSERPLPDGLAQRYPDCSALAIPLIDAGEPIGALILLRRPERWSFRPDETQRALTFGDLAALAFRKVHILEESERRREELERVTESRARLMRGFSHDLKNPLGAADGVLQLLEDGVLDGLAPEAKEGLGRARRAIHSALRLIDDLLELARAEAGQVEIRLGTTDLREAAQELSEDYRAQAEAEGLQLNVEVPDEFNVIVSDAARVRQILGNLLSNAVKYTPSGGTITVLAEERENADGRDGSWVTVSVRDTGPGIPEDQRRLLFREFTRLEVDGHKAGAGIGLAISKRIAHALGGDLTLDSEVGKGSTFTLWLPLEQHDVAARKSA